jgi:hypothetical protein
VMVQGKEAKKAGVTLEDCLGEPKPVASIPTVVRPAKQVCVETITYKDGTENCMKYAEVQ